MALHKMKTYIIGIGGVGGYYGGLLARGGADITLVCRREKAAILHEHGLSVVDRGEEFQTSNFTTIESIADIADPGLIIIATKAYDLDDVARQLAPVVTDDTIVLTLQNGVNSDLRVKDACPRGKVFAGLTWVISTMLRPGFVEQKCPRTFIRFGERDNTCKAQLTQVQQALESGGVEVQISNDIVHDLWEKFIWLSNFAGMAGCHKKAIGAIVNDQEAFELWVKGVDETLAVAKALNIAMDPNTKNIVLQKLENYKTNNTDFKPSLLVDLENGRRTEIDALSGTLIKLARDIGVPTPTHQMFYDAISNTS